MNIAVEYIDSKGVTHNQLHRLTRLAFVKHLAVAGLENLVSSCATCKYGKDGYTIEQLGIQNPFNREPILDKWNGLTDMIPQLK